MALYCIGDVQGCDAPLGRLLDKIGFSPSRDTIYLLGDLVNRGPQSAAVLRRLAGYGASAQCVLGNHDLHVLAVASGSWPPHRNDTMQDLLDAPDREPLLDWLRHRPLALYAHGVLMVHAGVLPGWDATKTVALGDEVAWALRQKDYPNLLKSMYGDQPDCWHDELQGMDRLRVIVNTLTRLRFCTPDGRMEFKAKGAADTAPAGFLPWFDVPGRKTAGVTVAFGHWSTLGWLDRPDVLAMDTGCAWGECLSAMRLGASTNDRELIKVQCV
jgi:bis(5'-nucleosyl)-tetraphosphatase (symmetrical)